MPSDIAGKKKESVRSRRRDTKHLQSGWLRTLTRPPPPSSGTSGVTWNIRRRRIVGLDAIGLVAVMFRLDRRNEAVETGCANVDGDRDDLSGIDALPHTVPIDGRPILTSGQPDGIDRAHEEAVLVDGIFPHRRGHAEIELMLAVSHQYRLVDDSHWRALGHLGKQVGRILGIQMDASMADFHPS